MKHSHCSENRFALKRASFLSVSIVAALTASIKVHAQSSGIEEVMVTAQQREQNLQDVPIAISAFDADAVESYMFNDVADYITRTPNASWSSAGSRSRRELSIRGITNFLNVNSTLRSTTFAFYVDDFSIVGSSGNPPMMDVERIEVLRGPQATYFGRNAMGGGISVTSNKPTSEFGGSVMVDYGNFNTKDIEGVLNIPVVEDVLALRANLKYLDTDGNIENINEIGGGNESTFEYGRLAARWTPSDALTVDFSVTSGEEETGMREGIPSGSLSFFGERLYGNDARHPEDSNGDGYREALPDGVGFWPNNTDKVNFDQPQSVGLDFDMFTARVDYEFNDMLFTSISGLIESDFYLNGDIDGSSFDSFTEDRNIARESVSQEFRLQSATDDTKLHWNLGLIYAQDKGHIVTSTFTGSENPFGLPAQLAISFDDSQEELDSWGLFGQFDYDLSDALNISLGGRWSSETRTVILTGDDIAEDISQEATFTNFLPRVAFSYGYSDEASLYGNISKGYKSGGVTNFDGLAIPYDQEEMWNYELGVKGDFLDGKMRVAAALFYMDWSDMQVEFLVPQLTEGGGGGNVISNAEAASSRGAELNITALPFENLLINFNLGYLDATLDKAVIFIRDNQCDHRSPSTECNQLLDGETTPMSPKWTSSADAEYTFPVSNSTEGFARLEWTFRDTVETTLVEGLVQEDGFPWQVPSYYFFNFRTGVSSENWTLTAYIENLTDEKYYQNAYVKAWAGGVAVEPSFQSYGVRFKYNF